MMPPRDNLKDGDPDCQHVWDDADEPETGIRVCQSCGRERATEAAKAYHERNLLVGAFIGALVETQATDDQSIAPDHALECGHTEPAAKWDVDGDDWRLVWMEIPGYGQVSWHLPTEYVPAWLPERALRYDGHDVEQKNQRVAAYVHVPDREVML